MEFLKFETPVFSDHSIQANTGIASSFYTNISVENASFRNHSTDYTIHDGATDNLSAKSLYFTVEQNLQCHHFINRVVGDVSCAHQGSSFM